MPSVISIAWDSSSARLRVLTDGYGAGQIATAAIVSGKLADNSIHLAAIPAGLFLADATGRGKFANAFLVSSLVAVGAIGGGLVRDLGVLSGKMANYAIHSIDIDWAALTSGKYAAGSVRTADIGATQIVSSLLGALAVGTPHLADASIIPTKVAALAIGSGLIADQGILSGKIGSGSIDLRAIPDNLLTEAKLVSGISIDIAEQLSENTYSAREPISSYALVYLDNDRKVKLATALSGLMPAMGINSATLVASGGLPLLSYAGRAAAPSSVISGQYKKLVYVGANAQVVLTAPGSGFIIQPVGIVASDSTIFFIPTPVLVEVA